MLAIVEAVVHWFQRAVGRHRLKHRYQATIANLESRLKLAEKSVQSNFKSIYGLSDMIDDATAQYEALEDAAQGAVDFYVDDPHQSHRVEGEKALAKAHHLRGKIDQWLALRQAHQVTSLQLREARDDIANQIVLLKNEMTSALSSFDAAHYELSMHRRNAQQAELDRHADKHLDALKRAKQEEKAWRAARSFLQTDPLQDYKERGRNQRPSSPSSLFDEMLRKRKEAREEARRKRGEVIVVNG